MTTAYLLLHRCCPGGGTCVGNGAGPVIIALSQRSGAKKCVRSAESFGGRKVRTKTLRLLYVTFSTNSGAADRKV